MMKNLENGDVMNSEVKVPEGAELFDECFYVWETRFGLYSSMTTKGREMSL